VESKSGWNLDIGVALAVAPKDNLK
jgi:hypothetical protein